jgi:hypothetical protein
MNLGKKCRNQEMPVAITGTAKKGEKILQEIAACWRTFAGSR